MANVLLSTKAVGSTVKLTVNGTQNRRSTEVLRVAADGFLKNAFGGGVTVTTEPDGEKIEVCGCSSQEDEAKKIFSIIGNYDGDRTDICVMTRSNRYAANLYKSLTRLNSSLPKAERIPFFTADGRRGHRKALPGKKRI